MHLMTPNQFCCTQGLVAVIVRVTLRTSSSLTTSIASRLIGPASHHCFQSDVINRRAWLTLYPLPATEFISKGIAEVLLPILTNKRRVTECFKTASCSLNAPITATATSLPISLSLSLSLSKMQNQFPDIVVVCQLLYRRSLRNDPRMTYDRNIAIGGMQRCGMPVDKHSRRVSHQRAA
jgi:hypothetical protein